MTNPDSNRKTDALRNLDGAGTVVLFFVETPGITAEVSLGLGSATLSGTPGCSASTEDGDTVLRAINAVRKTPVLSHFILKLIMLPG